MSRRLGFLYTGVLVAVGLLQRRVRFRVREWVVGDFAFIAIDRRRTRLGQVARLQTFEADAQVFVELPAVRRAHFAINGAIRQSVFAVAAEALTRRRFWGRRRFLLCGCVDGGRGYFGGRGRLALVGVAAIT